jgi:hypothetical protein
MGIQMKVKASLDSSVKWLFLCSWFALFIGGVTHYTGSWLTYTMFSVVFLTMLISGFYRQISYGYLFLVVMLWLGFWLKFTVHLVVDYPFGESIGLFDGSALAWDEVLSVAAAGGLGVIAGRILYRLAGGVGSSMLANKDDLNAVVPEWYSVRRRWLWVGLVLACVGLAIINASLGILQIGLVPKIYLIWPMNAVICWLIGYGFTLFIATLLWWDIALGRNVSLVVYLVLLEAFTSSVSTLSRGGYIFHAVPQFLALYKNQNWVSMCSRRNTVFVCVAFIGLFAISNPLVNMLRNFYYDNSPSADIKTVGSISNVGVGSISSTGAGLISSASAGSISSAGAGLKALAKFAVDRWIGTEGVMAVSAHSKKGVELLTQGLKERREIGKDSLYIEISRPVYLGKVDKSKFQFSEIPGAMAFLYYSGRIWVVMLGMVVLVLVLLISERFVFRLTKNPLLSALWGGAVANTVAQMGVAPSSLLIYYFEMLCGIAAIYFIQSQNFASLLQKIGATTKVKGGVL